MSIAEQAQPAAEELGKPLYERFMRCEYAGKWEELTNGTRARWNDAATAIMPAAMRAAKAQPTPAEYIHDAIVDAGTLYGKGASKPLGLVASGSVIGQETPPLVGEQPSNGVLVRHPGRPFPPARPVVDLRNLTQEQSKEAARLCDAFFSLADDPSHQTQTEGEPDLTMLLMSKADAVRKEYQLAHGRPCDCTTPDSALHYGRAQGLEIASDIAGASPSPDKLAEVTKERDHFYNQWRACWAPLTPRSENEKQGVERVLAILKSKLSDGGGIVGPSDVQRAHNDFHRGRRVAFEECATMLRAALTTEGQP